MSKAPPSTSGPMPSLPRKNASSLPPTSACYAADGGEIIAELHAFCHAAGCGVALTGAAPITRIVLSSRQMAGAPRAHHRLAFPLVAPIDFRQAVQAQGFPKGPRQRQGRLQLFSPA